MVLWWRNVLVNCQFDVNAWRAVCRSPATSFATSPWSRDLLPQALQARFLLRRSELAKGFCHPRLLKHLRT